MNSHRTHYYRMLRATLFCGCLLLISCSTISSTPVKEVGEILPTKTQQPAKTPTPIPSITSSPTLVPTTTPVTPHPTKTSAGITIPTDQPVPTPTVSPTPLLSWSDSVKPLSILEGMRFMWSPIADEAIFLTCGEDSEIMLIAEPFFEPIAIHPMIETLPNRADTPICGWEFGLSWHPTGKQFLFPLPIGFGENELWIVDKTGQNPQKLSEHGEMLTIHQWLTNDLLLYGGYGGGGHRYAVVVNVTNGQRVTSLPLAWGTHQGIGVNFTSWTPNSFQFWHKPYVHTFSLDRDTEDWRNQPSPPTEIEFPIDVALAVQQEWIPNSDVMIVRTWSDVGEHWLGEDLAEFEHDLNLESDIYLWDVSKNVATLLVEGGRESALRPNGGLLAINVHHPSTQTQIIDLTSQTVVDTFANPTRSVVWLNDTHLLYNSNTIRNVVTTEEVSLLQQEGIGRFLSQPTLSYSGRYLSLQECPLEFPNLDCKTHILQITLP